MLANKPCGAFSSCSSTKVQRAWRSTRPAARSSQQHTASTFETPEGLNLIDSLFESVTKAADYSDNAVHASEQQATGSLTARTATADAVAEPTVNSTPSNLSNDLTAAVNAPHTQRSKLLQRLQAKRATAAGQAAPQSPNALVDATKDTAHTKLSSSRRALSSQQLATSGIAPGPRQQVLTESESATVDVYNSREQHLSTGQAGPSTAGAAAVKGIAPRNPWLVRQEQQRKLQQQIQQQQQAARQLALQQQQLQQQQELEEQRLLQKQQLQQQLRLQQQQQQQQDVATAAAAAAAAPAVVPGQQPPARRIQSATKGLKRIPTRLLQQQQRQSPLDIMPAANLQRPQQWQQQLQQQRASSANPLSTATAAAAPEAMPQQQKQQQSLVPRQQPQQQQQSVMPRQQQQSRQQAAVDLNGMIRSSRRSRPARAAAAAQSTTAPSAELTGPVLGQTHEQQLPAAGDLGPAAAAAAAATSADPSTTVAAAAAAGDFGQMPLVVTGGHASGSDIVWQQEAQVHIQGPPAAAAAAAGSASGSSQSRSSGSNSSSTKAGLKVSRSGRYRRTAKVLQGVVTSPDPDLPPLAAVAAAAAAAAAVAAPAALAADTHGSSSSSVAAAQDIQQQQQRLEISSSNWQQLAGQILPHIVDPTYHTSIYTLSMDAWAAALLPAAAAVRFSSSSSTTSRDPAAAAWCMSCLYSTDRYIWCSTLLALLDSLADDADGSRAGLSVAVLPSAVLQQLVLPAAEILDGEVHKELLQAVKQSEGGSGSSRVAAQSVIGAAPWLKQQQQRHTTGELSSSSSSDDHSSTARSSSHLISDPAAATAADGDEVVPGASELLDALRELQQLQGLYPGVDLSALAHVAQLHGVWT